MSGVSRRRFLGLDHEQAPRAVDKQGQAAPRSYLEDFYARRGRQAETPLVFHPTVVTFDTTRSDNPEDDRT